MPRKKKYITAVIDAETDPFMHGRIPEPFSWEFYSETRSVVFWGDDCTEQLLVFLTEELTEPHMIFAHNGGKFDFHLLHAYLENPIKVINSRIVHATIGIHVLRDSLAIMPVPLARFFKGAKDDIDYRKMERPFRERFKAEILDYQHRDCLTLHTGVTAFVERFGPKLTVGSTAMSELIKLHEFEKMRPAQDALFRPFYHGGRVQCFQHGIITGPLYMYDVNSEYSAVMLNMRHPISANFHQVDYLPDGWMEPEAEPFFIDFTGHNENALPLQVAGGPLRFDVDYGRFQVCSHELAVAMRHDLVKIETIHTVWLPELSGSFREFVLRFYDEKTMARLSGDELGELFAKFMLNSAYGKFGSNPDNFRDWFINRDFGNDTALRANGYILEVEYEEFELWSRPAANADNSFYNVATAASITSGARSIMLEGIQDAIDPIYCDTDSLLCRGFTGKVSATELGAWKLEKQAPMAAVAGKKLYTLYDPKTLKLPKTVACPWNPNFRDPNPERKALKLSSKGGSLTVDEVIAVAKGDRVLYQKDAPTFSLTDDTRFIHRNFRMTVDEPFTEE